MYISTLLINVGDNPDRPRPGRLWLRNLYHVHQRLCMAFPTPARKEPDPDFLAPYDPGDFANGHVHVTRGEDSGFLFRIDPVVVAVSDRRRRSEIDATARVMIIVQSAAPPDWDYAFGLKEGLVDERGRPIGNAGYLLAAPPQVNPHFDPRFTAGERLRFRLLANPTRRFYSRDSVERDSEPVREKWIGKRVPVPHEQLLDWLVEWQFRQDGREEPSGFSIDKDRTTVQAGYVYFKKPIERRESDTGDETDENRRAAGRRLFAVRYQGILEVTDSDKFRSTLMRGVGPGKAFGFGLLSVAPV